MLVAMLGFENGKRKKQRIGELQAVNRRLIEVKSAAVNKRFATSEEREEAWESVVAETQLDENRSLALQHRPLLEAAQALGIRVTEEWLETRATGYFQTTLTIAGELWLTREIRNTRFTIVKDWVAIISPVLSAIIAILGLVVALRRH